MRVFTIERKVRFRGKPVSVSEIPEREWIKSMIGTEIRI